MKNEKNIALIASRGAHSTQAKIICNKNIVENRKLIFITESDDFNEKINWEHDKLYLFKKDNLNLNPWPYFITLLKLRKIFKKENIGIVITTGAHLALPAVIAAKILGIKTIYIESAVRVNNASLSGKFSYPFSDVFLVQHKEAEKQFGKKAKYIGGVL